jgi:hypothetical protein
MPELQRKTTMNPTPEQLAFAFALMSLRQNEGAEPPLVSSSLLSGLFRVVAITVVGLATGLLGLTYIEGTVATNGFSQSEIRSFGDPSPVFNDAIAKDDDDVAPVARTAFAQ